ncbi:hypothetical protein [Massilia aerilata]|uniref:DUF1311 domain-containing protein n=1 Tax=Massilia aerilata TaxID=453817 RepID=A0ABW0RSN2_9BURK
MRTDNPAILRWLRGGVALLVAIAMPLAPAQTRAELESQYRSTCTPDFLSANPEMRDTCKTIRATIDAMATPDMRAQPAAAPGQDAGFVDNTAQCKCNRKLGRCSASASIKSKVISMHAYGRSSKVVVHVSPPAGQCSEVTVFLQESAQLGAKLNRVGHPLHRVVTGPTDIEWTNGSTPATSLAYAILHEDTECYICEGAGRSAGSEAGVDQELKSEIRDSYEMQYKDCLKGRLTGMDANVKIAPALMAKTCERLREAWERNR